MLEALTKVPGGHMAYIALIVVVLLRRDIRVLFGRVGQEYSRLAPETAA
jgi:hypothetical protein